MGEDTRVPWAKHTWNPWIGCNYVSEACRNCYAEAWARRSGTSWAIHQASGSTFMAPMSKRWRANPGTVFTCSLSDFCHEGADEWRPDAWEVIRATPFHTYLILTKRPERLPEMLRGLKGWPLPNVWIGVTVEDQDAVENRLPWLHHPSVIQAAGLFISMEPLLETVDIEPFLRRLRPAPLAFSVEEPDPLVADVKPLPAVDWVIIGGESGNNARPMLGWWPRRILDVCSTWKVPAYMKQLSQREGRWFKDPDTWPEALQVQQFPEVLRGD